MSDSWTPWQNGWEKGKKLGEGGEGEVFLVRRLTVDPKQIEKLKLSTQRTIAHAGGSVKDPNGLSADFFESVRLIADMQQSIQFGALKVISRPTDPTEALKTQERIRREIETMKVFGDHPNCLRVLDVGPDGFSFVTEYHAGGPLSSPANRARYRGDLPRALRDLRGVVELLSHIHPRKHVHRDVATKNIFVAADGRLILGDWGIVWFGDAHRTRLSIPGDVMGTKDMMPPWVRAGDPDNFPPAFDVYCVGKVLWQMVAASQSPLLREYWGRDQYNLEKRFLNSPSVRYASELLKRTVVEDMTDCIANGEELLKVVDLMLERMGRAAEPFKRDVKRYCSVCGIGQYAMATSGTGEPTDIERDQKIAAELGFAPRREFVIHLGRCDHCGHVQVFQWPSTARPPGWQ